REKHDGIVDAVSEDDGAEKCAGGIHVTERGGGKRIRSTHSEQGRQSDDGNREGRPKKPGDPQQDQQKGGSGREKGIADERLLLLDGVRNVARVADAHARVERSRSKLAHHRFYTAEKSVPFAVTRTAGRGY